MQMILGSLMVFETFPAAMYILVQMNYSRIHYEWEKGTGLSFLCAPTWQYVSSLWSW